MPRRPEGVKTANFSEERRAFLRSLSRRDLTFTIIHKKLLVCALTTIEDAVPYPLRTNGVNEFAHSQYDYSDISLAPTSAEF
ncbi:hypothetical protein Hsc_3655 [Herbaspirillum seropedicae]|nr:hypothetical protein Hsc_3655 [Herbaspirillum seropedicae]